MTLFSFKNTVICDSKMLPHQITKQSLRKPRTRQSRTFPLAQLIKHTHASHTLALLIALVPFAPAATRTHIFLDSARSRPRAQYIPDKHARTPIESRVRVLKTARASDRRTYTHESESRAKRRWVSLYTSFETARVIPPDALSCVCACTCEKKETACSDAI